MLPYLLSERAPVWDPDLAGAYFGVRLRHTRPHFLRAALEGVCLQVSTIADALEAVAPVREVRATGGTFRSPLWRTVMAGVLARPLVVETGAGGTALGATALGWYALGGAPDLPAALAALRGPVEDPAPVAVTQETSTPTPRCGPASPTWSAPTPPWPTPSRCRRRPLAAPDRAAR